MVPGTGVPARAGPRHPPDGADRGRPGAGAPGARRPQPGASRPVGRRPAAVPDLVAASAYFTVAEALTNVAKHSAAPACAVTARADGDRLEVTVTDSGIGEADLGGPGLRGIADRVEAVGGELRVDSPPGQGTRVTAVLPLPQVDRPPAVDAVPAASAVP